MTFPPITQAYIPVDLRRGRQVQARDEDVGRGEVSEAEDGGPGGVVADVLGEGRAHGLERVIAADGC